MEKTAKTASQVTQPIIIELGRQKAKKLRELKKGEGELWDDVLAVVEQVQAELGETAEGKVIVPVVMVYEKKLKRQRLEKMLFPYL